MRLMQLNIMEMGSETVNCFVLAPVNNWLGNFVSMALHIVYGKRWTISGSTGGLYASQGLLISTHYYFNIYHIY